MAVHEFHVWQLAGNRIIGSAHIRCKNLRDYMRIAEQVKAFFHNEGIHSTTIQPEFAEVRQEFNCLHILWYYKPWYILMHDMLEFNSLLLCQLVIDFDICVIYLVLFLEVHSAFLSSLFWKVAFQNKILL